MVLYASFVEHELHKQKFKIKMKTIKALKFFLFCIFLTFVFSCSVIDSKNFSNTLGSINFDESYGLVVDKDSNIIISGVYSDTLFFSSKRYLVSKGGSDIFVAKFLKNGELLWMISVGEMESDEAYNLAVNTDNEIYVCGHLGAQPFAAKYNAQGANCWLSTFAGKGECNDVLWKDEFIYVLGTFTDTLNHTLLSKGSSDIFVLQLNDEGAINQSNSFGLKGEDVGKRMIFTSDTTIAFCGSVTQNSSTKQDVALFAINTQLQLKESSFFGSRGDDIALTLKQNVHGDLFVCGQFSGDSIYSENKVMKVNYYGEFDAFLCKLDDDLSTQFFYTAGSAQNDWATDIAFSSSHHLLCSFVLNKEAVLHFNESRKVDGFGNYDIVLTSINAQNELDFVESFGNEKENGVNKILLSEGDKLFATGWFEGEFSFGKKNIFKALKGGDAFVFKGDLKSIMNSTGK